MLDTSCSTFVQCFVVRSLRGLARALATSSTHLPAVGTDCDTPQAPSLSSADPRLSLIHI